MIDSEILCSGQCNSVVVWWKLMLLKGRMLVDD
jgi:hypothetical protein